MMLNFKMCDLFNLVQCRTSQLSYLSAYLFFYILIGKAGYRPIREQGNNQSYRKQIQRQKLFGFVTFTIS